MLGAVAGSMEGKPIEGEGVRGLPDLGYQTNQGNPTVPVHKDGKQHNIIALTSCPEWFKEQSLPNQPLA